MTKKKRFNATFAAIIAASLAAVSLMAGCGAGSEDAKETRVVSETQVVTRVVNGVFTDEDGNILKDADGQPLTAPSGTPDSNEKEKSEKEGSKTSDGKTDSGSEEKDEKDEKSESGKSDSGDSKSDASSKSSESKKTPEKKGDDGDSSNNLKLGGKECEVGDTVICTYYVTCPTKFINFQATLNYDSDKLNVEDAELSGSASGGSVINYDLDGKVKFNGIKLNGYNYAKGGAFLTVTYKVLDSGSTDPKITWEIVTDASNNAMIVNGEPVSDFQIEAKYE